MRNTLRGAALRWIPYGDIGAVEVVAIPHPYLWCLCGERLYEGQTTAGAAVYVCRRCHLFVDQRRLA